MRNIIITALLIIGVLLQGCELPEITVLKVYRVNGKLTVDGIERTYLLNLPPTYYDNASTFSLVIAMHGTGGKATQFEQDYRFTEKANASNFIVVYPEGVRNEGPLGIRSWNAGTCCEYAMENNIDDVHYLSELIKYLSGKYKIDPKRVYATGMSNGGMMAYRLACEIPDQLAAIAPVSSTMVADQPCDPSRAVPVLHIHSIPDKKVPYRGGYGIRNYYFPSIDSVLNVWSTNNHCATEAQVLTDNEKYRLTQWSDCNNAVTLNYYLTKDGGHAWPGGQKSSMWADEPSTAINANDVIWNFFQQHRLP